MDPWKIFQIFLKIKYLKNYLENISINGLTKEKKINKNNTKKN